MVNALKCLIMQHWYSGYLLKEEIDIPRVNRSSVQEALTNCQGESMGFPSIFYLTNWINIPWRDLPAMIQIPTLSILEVAYPYRLTGDACIHRLRMAIFAHLQFYPPL